MVQTAVNDEPAIAFEGMVLTDANYPNTIVSHAASGSIYYGKAVSLYDDNEVTLGSQRVKLPAAALDLAATNFKGVAIADTSLESTSNAYGEYFDKDSVPVIKKGRIWVVSADIVDDVTKGVYIRHANGAAAPANTLGSFRATVNADYTLMGDNVRWVAGTTISGVYYGLLELNLDV